MLQSVLRQKTVYRDVVGFGYVVVDEWQATAHLDHGLDPTIRVTI